MTNGLYDPLETDSSWASLEGLASVLPKPVVLLGGWAVFLTVNESYKAEAGRDYLGSKDVDLGFHIDPNWSLEELNASNYAKALKAIEALGYHPAGTSRYHKIIHMDSKEILSEQAATKVPMHDLFYLYLDPIVDVIHPKHDQIFAIKPIDEPLLAKPFTAGIFQKIKVGSSDLMIPDTSTLLATKLASFPNRDKEHKRIKDACDIYALLWHSPDDFRTLVDSTQIQYPHLCKGVGGLMEDEVSIMASTHLGVGNQTFRDVVSRLVK